MTEEHRQNLKDVYHTNLIEEALKQLSSPDSDGIAHLRPGLELYLTDRIETGGFLRCVLENTLAEAVHHAHPALTMMQMKTLVTTIAGSFPSFSWGSPEKVSAWLKKGEEKQ